MAKPIGVTRPKKTKAITRGVIIFPSKIPNLNHNKLRGVSIIELIIPKNRNMIDSKINQILKSLLKNNKYKPITKNKIEKTIPKFLFVGNLALSFIRDFLH